MTKFPTINGTLRIIREMGLAARYDGDTKEFIIGIKGNANSTYFTNGRHDALFTARSMTVAIGGK